MCGASESYGRIELMSSEVVFKSSRDIRDRMLAGGRKKEKLEPGKSRP